jgi:hypothetical protein
MNEAPPVISTFFPDQNVSLGFILGIALGADRRFKFPP